MVNRFIIVVVFGLSVLTTQQVYSLNNEEVERLTTLMVTGCSLGQKFSISIEGDGNLSFLKKGIKGKFQASKSEIPAIIDFLLKDELRADQADKIRNCMQKYMDQIFNEVLANKDQLSSKVKHLQVKKVYIDEIGYVSLEECTYESPCSGLERGLNLHLELNTTGYAAVYLQDRGNYFNQEGRLIVQNSNIGDIGLWPGTSKQIENKRFTLYILISDRYIPTFADSVPLKELPEGTQWGPVYLLAKDLHTGWINGFVRTGNEPAKPTKPEKALECAPKQSSSYHNNALSCELTKHATWNTK
ncbi:MAG: hypothetical protein GY861_27180 [bacterium]|nr:hypothetical protein [bacterium]